MSGLSRLSRPEMRTIAGQLLEGLQARAASGPPEPSLDDFIPQLAAVNARLSGHLAGGAVADARRRSQLVRLDEADDEVDTWLRHVAGFLEVEARRRTGNLQEAVKALKAQAFPEGLSPIRAYVPEENLYCRTAIAVLQSAAHAPTVAAIRLPADWLTAWATAIEASEAAFIEASKARQAQSHHVSHGMDAKGEFVEVARRLRHYVQSRASRREKSRVDEGERLLSPLTLPLKKLRMEDKARATRREKAAQEGSAAQASQQGEVARAAQEGSAAEMAPEGESARAALEGSGAQASQQGEVTSAGVEGSDAKVTLEDESARVAQTGSAAERPQADEAADAAPEGSVADMALAGAVASAAQESAAESTEASQVTANGLDAAKGRLVSEESNASDVPGGGDAGEGPGGRGGAAFGRCRPEEACEGMRTRRGKGQGVEAAMPAAATRWSCSTELALTPIAPMKAPRSSRRGMPPAKGIKPPLVCSSP
ncbi:uncharacterized protein CMC5_077070 [Chondromyces crocatus]|uniref:Uncharacterized protein n=1 Tax=Chondromyces crocatus TaxID=52 RepID=A0A0K1ERB7_CHOCO|nr:hypothetical protein [Chondromyces crocatus]AKT43475.1 uncharacterized protein CMC5_077070 [Chondromyces crocatus]